RQCKSPRQALSDTLMSVRTTATTAALIVNDPTEHRSKSGLEGSTMKNTLDSLRVRAGVVLAACAFLVAGAAWADPPGRAVRLAHMNGPVSFLAAGDNDWVQAANNRPLWTGDRLWTGSGARAELQIAGPALRIAPETSITVVNFDDRIAQFQVTQGAVQIHARTIESGDTIE